MLLLTLMLGCSGGDKDGTVSDDSALTGADSGSDDSGSDDSGSDDSGSDDTGDGPVTLAASCEAPASLPDDPLSFVGEVKLTQSQQGQFFVELIDLELAGDFVYGVGQGGFMVYDVSDPSDPQHVGSHPANRGRNINSRYHRVERAGEDFVVVTHRDIGMAVLDVTDPTTPTEVHLILEQGLEGLAFWDDKLAVTVRGEGLRVYDLSDPANPQLLGGATGLEAPWELSPVIDGWSYVADNSLGVVPVDLRDPENPVLGTPLSLDGATLHVTTDGEHLFASQASQGVAILEVSDPSAPSVVGVASTGGSTVMASAADGVLWVVDHEGLSAFDISDPTAPASLGHQITEQFALAVRGSGQTAWVGDWNILSGWELDPNTGAGEIDLTSDVITAPTDGGVAEVQVYNRGSGPLTLSGATVSDESLSLTVSRAVIPAGESATLSLEYAGGESLEATLCLASDDADQPTLEVDVIAGRYGQYIGLQAPDFELNDLDQTAHRLSDQLGNPVLLAYFATW